MKYTIELTENQKKQMDALIEIAHKHIGFSPKLEPITSDVAGYMTSEEIKAIKEKAKQEAYDNGYNNALEDLSHAMKVYFPLNSRERLDYFGTNVQVETYAVGNPKNLIAKAKAYEEKKEKEIKVGDEVKDLSTSNIGVVLSIGRKIVYITNLYHVYSNTRGSLEKTGRHFDEIGQLLCKVNDGEKENEHI